MRKNCRLAAFGVLSVTFLFARLMAAPFSDGDTVVFLGDSITHGGRYHGFITDFYRTRYPDRTIRFVNSGIGGDSAIGAQKRLHEDVAEYRPTHVALHFGMNDVDREAYAVETTTDRLRRRSDAQARYRMNFDNLVAQVKAVAPQASLIYLSTTIYDDTAIVTNIPPQATGWAIVNQVGCSAGLAQMAGHVLSKAKTEGVLGVDWYTPLNSFLRRHQANDPHFMLTSWDRVHPNALGHSLMAWTFLTAQGVSPVVSEVRINAAQGVVETCANAALTNLASGRTGASFVLRANALPMPVSEVARAAYDELGVAERLNREVLAVTELVAGRYVLTIDDVEVGSYDAEELAGGVNLAMNERTPQYVQAQAVARRNAELWGEETVLRNHHSARWFFYGRTDVDDLNGLAAYVAAHDPKGYFSQFVPGYISYWPSYRATRAALLAKQQAVYTLAKPVPHRYVIKPEE